MHLHNAYMSRDVKMRCERQSASPHYVDHQTKGCITKGGRVVEGDEGLDKKKRIRTVCLLNLFRVAMYSSVVVVQCLHLGFVWFSAWAFLDWLFYLYSSGSDLMLVLTPLLLALLDALLMMWSTRSSRGLMVAAQFVSLVAILISLNTLIPLVTSSTTLSTYEMTMLVLGTSVLMISLFDIILQRIGSLPDTERVQTIPSGDFRSYEG
jgi:hypothetical protein